jgi:hypothetical protein
MPDDNSPSSPEAQAARAREPAPDASEAGFWTPVQSIATALTFILGLAAFVYSIMLNPASVAEVETSISQQMAIDETAIRNIIDAEARAALDHDAGAPSACMRTMRLSGMQLPAATSAPVEYVSATPRCLSLTTCSMSM